jgi:Exopolysaccharide biosynthesis protein YbjH
MMKSGLIFLLVPFLLWAACSYGGDAQEDLMEDLLVVDYWNRRIYDRLPVTYNNFLQGGYFTMPSARMGEEGEIGIGYSYVPPYRNFNLRVQLFKRLELTGNYRVFRGIKDPVLSQFGFGDFSDKGANFKFAVILPEDSEYKLPGFAFGFDDIIGTRSFRAQYVVFTQVFLDYNMEISLGYGTERIRGFFGGINLMPFRKTPCKFLESLSLTAEYDATDYKSKTREPHPKGRVKKNPINFGIKYRLLDLFDFSLSYIRGDALSASVSAYYNWGNTTGFLPKIEDSLPYNSPVNTEPLGPRRPEDALVADLLFVFQEQGLEIRDIDLYYNECNQKILRIRTLNDTYRLECEVRCRLNHILKALTPSDIDEVIVVIDAEGFPIQEYHYNVDLVKSFAAKEISAYELKILTPMTEVTYPNPYTSTRLFGCKRSCFNFELSPKTHTLFGSSNGKFKYTLGLNASFNGYIWDDVYYNIILGWSPISNLGKFRDFDRLNPSQLINVRSDAMRFYKYRGLTVDEAYLQKNWNLGRGWYARIAGGYFEEAYGGASAEVLWYPVNSPWAIGLEGAILRKRNFSGLGFTNKIRKLVDFHPTYRKFIGSQCFLNLYYDWECARMDFKVTIGKFLANDWGVRNEISRYFPSGLRLSLWYTITNGNDRINGRRYYDKGICFSMPFDIFYTCSERTRWNYGMSAWLRDVGCQALTGLQLYELINDQRQ